MTQNNLGNAYANRIRGERAEKRGNCYHLLPAGVNRIRIKLRQKGLEYKTGPEWFRLPGVNLLAVSAT